MLSGIAAVFVGSTVSELGSQHIAPFPPLKGFSLGKHRRGEWNPRMHSRAWIRPGEKAGANTGFCHIPLRFMRGTSRTQPPSPN